jgi:glyoxylase-like metal-dependent hydrolase (beta-lactamase superfamily II)
MQEKKIHQLIVGDFATNCWIYPLDNVSGNGQPVGLNPCAVIDPGEEGGRITALLAEFKLFPSYIILTHGHFDHIGAVSALAKEYRPKGSNTQPGVTIAIHEADAEYLGPDSSHIHNRSLKTIFGSSVMNELLEPQPSPDLLLNEGDAIGPFTVLHLPGHTPGSIALWDEKAGIMFTGDTLFCGGYGRTDLPGGNSRLLHASLMRLFAMNGDIQVYPGHDGITTIRNEKLGMRNEE